MTIPDKSHFQPSAETLKKWLATRKPTIQIGGFPMSGFFSDTGNSSDTNWFWVSVIGEIIGLITIVYGGASAGDQFVLLAIFGVIMFVFCDFFFAQKLHRNKKVQCEFESQMLLQNDNNRSKIAALKLELGKGKFLDFLLQFGIILIALVKVLAIVFLGVFNSVILYIPFIIIFLIVAYVHINHTGHYFAYVSTQKAINREYAMFAGGAYVAKTPSQLVSTPMKLRDFPIKHNPHEIIEDTQKHDGNNYIIKTRGVLTDEDIVNLITGQEDANKIELFRACRKHQLENIEGQSSH